MASSNVQIRIKVSHADGSSIEYCVAVPIVPRIGDFVELAGDQTVEVIRVILPSAHLGDRNRVVLVPLIFAKPA